MLDNKTKNKPIATSSSSMSEKSVQAQSVSHSCVTSIVGFLQLLTAKNMASTRPMRVVWIAILTVFSVDGERLALVVWLGKGQAAAHHLPEQPSELCAALRD